MGKKCFSLSSANICVIQEGTSEFYVCVIFKLSLNGASSVSDGLQRWNCCSCGFVLRNFLVRIEVLQYRVLFQFCVSSCVSLSWVFLLLHFLKFNWFDSKLAPFPWILLECPQSPGLGQKWEPRAQCGSCRRRPGTQLLGHCLFPLRDAHQQEAGPGSRAGTLMDIPGHPGTLVWSVGVPWAS